jgi:ppGpp synthetase/RelA/SpoT-type nucleotidyltranferase
MRYRVLKKAVATARGSRREVLGRIHDAVQKQLAASRLKAELNGREKTMFGIYRKMVEKRLSFSEVLDIYGVRVIVNSVPDCYLALGALHGLYKPVPGKFKDYIAIPKVNGYQSLHTTLIGPFGTPVEFQIRTQEMNRVAESGVAAHWLYKEDDASLSELQSRTHQWLQSLIEIQKQTGDSKEFLENIKVDLFPEKVYVFTPRGKIVSLPRRATPVDFAYAIHTDIGNNCVPIFSAATLSRAWPGRSRVPTRCGSDSSAPARHVPRSGISCAPPSGRNRSNWVRDCSRRPPPSCRCRRRTSARSAGTSSFARLTRATATSCWPTSGWDGGWPRSWRARSCCSRPGIRLRRRRTARRRARPLQPSLRRQPRRWSCAAPKAWRFRWPTAAIRFPATRSWATCAATWGCWCTSSSAATPSAPVEPIRNAGSTCSGARI